jgi:hypothetical protein
MRFFQIAGITICLDADIDLSKEIFNPAILKFEVEQAGDESVYLHHSFNIPQIDHMSLGKLIHIKRPWAIYENKAKGKMYYQGILSDQPDGPMWCFAEFNQDYSNGKIYSNPESLKLLSEFGWHSLTLFPSDRFWLSQLLANRQGIMFHSAGAILNGKGVLFLGRSEAGKTTTVRQLVKIGEKFNYQTSILCDETNIVRNTEDGLKLFGTWSHGEEKIVSPHSAFLESIFVLKQSQENWVEPLSDQNQKMSIFLETLYRPLMTKTWWEKEFDLLEQIVEAIPVFMMYFDKSGDIIPTINELLAK